MRRIEVAEAKLRARRRKEEEALERVRNPQPEAVKVEMQPAEHRLFLEYMQRRQRASEPRAPVDVEALHVAASGQKQHEPANMLGDRHLRRQQANQPPKGGDQEMKLM